LRFIKELKPHYQEVIQLRYFQEMSYQEIANKIGRAFKQRKNQTSVLKNYWQKLFEINAHPSLAYNYPKAQLLPFLIKFSAKIIYHFILNFVIYVVT
jgi:hypothetical protein